MRRYTFVALLLTSCAMPSNVTIANRVIADGAAMSFQACGLSVRFAGVPREMHDNEAAAYTEAFGGAKNRWQIDGRVYQEFRLVQIGLCVCRDVAFSNAELQQAEQRLARRSSLRILPVAAMPFARKTLGFEQRYTEATDYVGEELRMIFPSRAPSCLFMAGGRSTPELADGIKAFFATFEPIGK